MKTLILIACLLASGPALAYCNYGDTPCERLERMEEQQNRIKADLRVLQNEQMFDEIDAARARYDKYFERR